jgi:hypothetical protein
MLRNIQYTGAYVSGKTPAKLDGTGLYYHARQNDWIMIPDRHPAIVSKAEFDTVQELMEQRQNEKREMKSRDYLLKGKIRCGCCGYALAYDVNHDPVYRCYKTAADPNAACHKMKVNVHEIDDAVLATVSKQVEILLNSDLSELRVKGTEAQQISDYEKQTRECVEQRQRFYEQFVLHEIDRETHQTLQAECAERIERLKSQIAVVRQAERDKQATKRTIAIAEQIKGDVLVPKEVVDVLIEKVLVFAGNHIEIQWKIANFANTIELEKKRYAS